MQLRWSEKRTSMGDGAKLETLMEPKDTYELFARGLELMDGGHNHQAAIILERAAKQEPDKGSIREALARALFNSGQFARAKQEFEAAIELHPADHYAHFGLALCHARLGHKVRAVGLLKIAIAMKPDAEDYQRALGRLAG